MDVARLTAALPPIERRTLCLSSPQPGIAAHFGELGFAEGISKYFLTAENNAAERLVELKAELRDADTETFWKRLMEGMTEICHAQYGFVAKRILLDDHDSAIEMPPLGEQGSCLLGVAFYYNDGQPTPTKGMHRDYKYLAWGAPCAHMRHDKVFLIPEKLSTFITNNPNAFPFPSEAYLGIPLYSEGKCFAHFGMMWTQEGLDQRDVSWAFLELILHSLEDLILERLLKGESFAKQPPDAAAVVKKKRVIPQEAITASQSLKPYARSLSHELRTPMQGVVGMLDVMHATVQEAIEGQQNSKLRNIFQALKENIEVVQDSSRRAVEAADNVVHAYDMNMQVPDTPQDERDSPALGLGLSSTSVFENRPHILIEGSNIPVNPHKRRRSSPVPWHVGTATKLRDFKTSPRRELSPHCEELKHALEESQALLRSSPGSIREEAHLTPGVSLPTKMRRSSTKTSLDSDALHAQGLRHANLRELVPLVIHESLQVGGRPESAVAEPTELGERIDVRIRSSSGATSQKVIEWSVHPDIAEYLLVDERDLAKLISCVFLNAIKFTEVGTITLTARPAKNPRFILISVVDTGTGIPKDFLPELFKPFSREDDSLTRSKEGLGLGLLVAKGLARRIGGDLELVRSETSGESQGSEFEIKVPINTADISSGTDTPINRTPTPSRGGSYHSGSDLTRKAATYHSKTANSIKAGSPLRASSPARRNSHPTSSFRSLDEHTTSSPPKMSAGTSKVPASKKATYDRKLAERHPLTFLVAEDNKINRKLLVSMLSKFGYKDVYEAFDGKEAVRIMSDVCRSRSMSLAKATDGKSENVGKQRLKPVDVILMDLWMPEMDGYEATERIFQMFKERQENDSNRQTSPPPTVLAVSADVTDVALSRATTSGMEGFMTKPYKLMDLQRLIEEFCGRREMDVSA